MTQPTVNRHIRGGEQTLFGLLYDQPDETDNPTLPSGAGEDSDAEPGEGPDTL